MQLEKSLHLPLLCSHLGKGGTGIVTSPSLTGFVRSIERAVEMTHALDNGSCMPTTLCLVLTKRDLRAQRRPHGHHDKG